MKRVKQLLAKGIDKLDEAEHAELMTLLGVDSLREMSAAELAELEEAIRLAADELIEDDDNSDGLIAALAQLADVLDVVKGETDRRAVEAEEAEARKQELRDRIRGAEEEPTAEADPEDPEDDGEAEPEGEEEPAPVEDANAPVLVTASSSTNGPVITRVAARRPSNRQPKSRNDARQAPITAAAGLPGIAAGFKLSSDQQVFQAFDAAVAIARGSDAAFKMPVIQLHSDIPDEMQLDRDGEANHRKIEARSNLEALTASGGACAPVPYRYDLVTVGDDVRPVRDGLNKFGAQRGGVALFTPPTITDVSGTGATTSAVSEWTYANDVNPTSPTTKPYLRIACGSDTATTTRVNAIVEQYESGNMMERWYPELIAAYTKLIGVYHSRFADAKILAGISSLAKAVTHGQVLGSATDVITALDQLIMGIRYRHRIVSKLPMRVIGFEWVRQSIIADLIRRGAADRPLEERLVLAEATIDTWFRAHNCNVTWSPDFQFGRSIGQAGGPPAGVQGVGAAIGYPSVARFYVFVEGSVLFLDGGELRLGVMRDVTKARTNDWVYFSESFENVAYNGVPGELYTYDIDICANGGYSSPLDIAPCVSNS